MPLKHWAMCWTWSFDGNQRYGMTGGRGYVSVLLWFQSVFSLIHALRGWADGSAIYAFLYVNNWTWYYLDSPGARHDLITISGNIFLEYGTFVCWAWTSGFALGSISRRTLLVTGPLFCVAILAGTVERNPDRRQMPVLEPMITSVRRTERYRSSGHAAHQR
jgi:hypothetical protein